MRGEDEKQEGMFSYVSPEKRVPADHPLRPIRAMVDQVLKEMSPRFARLYAKVGRPSIAPERLLRALLLADLLLGARRAPADGAVGLQPFVPLVRGHDRWTRRCGTTACSARTATGC